ncbi:cysteine proteinase, partial [Neoconidiobolus thromboides FSU 785]
MSKCAHITMSSDLGRLDLKENGGLSPLQMKFINMVQIFYLKANIPKVKGVLNLRRITGSKRSGPDRKTISRLSFYTELDKKFPSLSCGPCGRSVRNRSVACLECDVLQCTRHSMLHSKESKHVLGLKYQGLTLFCLCCDVILENNVIEILRSSAITNLKQRLKNEQYDDINALVRKKLSDIEVVQECFESSRCLSLRGIRNVGNTCFVNCILQMITHNPTFSDIFLSMDRNDCITRSCMSCTIRGFIIQYYSNNPSPMIITSLLKSIWNSSKHLAGYEQQDAHEFFIALINKIHEDEVAHHGVEPGTTEKPCICPVHRTFGGELQSSVTCLSCNYISNKGDPYLDNALDLKNPKKRRIHTSEGSEKKMKVPELELKDCLRGYVHTETLSADSYKCSKCKAQTEATKQMTFKTLSPVLSFQLKRYSHDPSNLSKVNTKIHLPLKLDMTPYVANATKLPIFLRNGTFSETKENTQTSSLFNYTLFAVVHHIGSLDNGHYISYMRLGGKWFKFDDHNVDIVEHEDVINHKAYLCYYLADPEPLPC